MTSKTGNEKGEEKEMEKVCKCNEKCDGSGWIWNSQDLGNRITDGTRSHKAGRFWASICPNWKGGEQPPNPPGISDMSKWMHKFDGGEGKGHSGGGWHGN